MKKESVLILGAGLMQSPAINAARRNGFKTFVIDANPNAESVFLADEFRQIDLKDKERIFEFASELHKKENLKAVFTAGTDFSASVSYVCEKLGLCAHSYEAALNASIKPRMRACFERAGVPSPEYFSFSCESDLRDEQYCIENIQRAVEKLGFPCVVKPADNMGARGCRMIRSREEIVCAVENAVESSRTGTIILERYMEGPEYSIDAVVYNGTLTVTGFADRHIYYPPYFIETGHTMPTAAGEKEKAELIAAFAAGVKALGLTCGAAKADIKYTPDGPEIGEIAARLSGGYMSGWTFPYSSGLNLTEQALLIAAGRVPEKLLRMRRPVDFRPYVSSGASASPCQPPFELYEVVSKKTSAERAWISIPGTIASISGIRHSERTRFVKNVFPRPVHSGEEAVFPRNNVQKCGNAISLSKNRDKAVNASCRACSRAFIRLEPHNERTERFLKGETSADERGFPPPAYRSFLQLEHTPLSGIIPENSSVLRSVPPEIQPLLDSAETDWNYLTLRKSAERFDRLCRKHPAIPQERFWKALLKGGIQAAVYVSDSLSENK